MAQSGTGETEIARGNEFFVAADFGSARTWYSRVIDSQIDNNKSAVVALCNRSAVNLRLELVKHALRDAESAIELDPFHAKAWLRKGQALAALGRDDEALDAWGELLGLDSDIDDYCFVLHALGIKTPAIPLVNKKNDQEEEEEELVLPTIACKEEEEKGKGVKVNGSGDEVKKKSSKEEAKEQVKTSTSSSSAVSSSPKPAEESTTKPKVEEKKKPVEETTKTTTKATAAAAKTTTATPSKKKEKKQQQQQQQQQAAEEKKTTTTTSSPLPPASTASPTTTNNNVSSAKSRSSSIPIIEADDDDSDSIDIPQYLLDRESSSSSSFAAGGGGGGGGQNLRASRALEPDPLAHPEGGPLTISGSMTEEILRNPEALAALAAAQSMISNGVGNISVDEKIALGYLNVNTGKFAEGIAIFDVLLTQDPKLIGAYLGRGTAHALAGRLPEAVKDFSIAISVDKNCGDAWKRRGQTRAALGFDKEAVADLTKAASILNDAECYHQRGIIYHKIHDYRRGLADFLRAVQIAPKNAIAWNFVGLCRAALGQVKESIAAYRKAIEADPGLKEAVSNLAQVYRESGDAVNAEDYFSQALQLDHRYVHGYYLRGLLRYGIGDLRGAAADFAAGCSLNSSDLNCLSMHAVTLHSLGRLRESINVYNLVVEIDGNHFSWYQREVALFVHHHLDKPMNSFNLDVALDPYFKEAMCKRFPLNHPRMRNYRPQSRAFNSTISDVELRSIPPNMTQIEVLEMSRNICKLLQYNTPGFLQNKRQHRCCALSVVQMAQAIRAHWQARRDALSSSPPIVQTSVPTSTSASASSSSSNNNNKGGKKNSKKGGGGGGGGSSGADKVSLDPTRAEWVAGSTQPNRVSDEFTWRDFMDIAVKWRQISEPNDCVFWIDLLAPEAFAEGFGLQTPIQTGQMMVVRYSPYHDMAVEIVREMLEKRGGHNVRDIPIRPASNLVPDLREAKNCQNLFDVMKEGFYVETQCFSTARPSAFMSGTRITLLTKIPDGFDLTIRTPGTPARWQQYASELAHIWTLISDVGSAATVDFEKLSDLFLTFYYYWCNFGALSRGTAACGMFALLALFLAAGYEIDSGMPAGVQTDWEAILRPTPKDFIEHVSPWLYPARKKTDVLDKIPSCAEAYNTIRRMVEGLNAD